MQRLLNIKKDKNICNIGPEFLASPDEVEAYLERNLDPPPLKPL